MGVWIEIFIILLKDAPQRSLPVWECGLKLYLRIRYQYEDKRHSLYGSVD